MNKTIILPATFLLFIVLGFVFLNSLVINEPTEKNSEIKEVTIISVKEGQSYDIVFQDSNDGHYYINRGIEKGLTVEQLRDKVLNKKATLYLAKLWIGTSEHISQVQTHNEIIFTEFD